MSVIEARINALVSPYDGITGETNINSVIKHHGYIGLAKGLTVLHLGTLGTSEYLRVMEENKRQLLLAEKMEKELLTYLENPDTIPNEVYRNVMRGQRLFAQIEHDLKQCRQEMKQTYNYIFNLVKSTGIIDGKAFEADMSALLIKYIAELMEQKEQEAMCILEQRQQPKSNVISYVYAVILYDRSRTEL